MTSQRKIAAPVSNVETQPCWDGANKGKLLVKKCLACGEHHFYPARALSLLLRRDGMDRGEGEQGEIYSFSVMRRARLPMRSPGSGSTKVPPS